eukprot:343343-Chlamydomonas_euryale.AAC.1
MPRHDGAGGDADGAAAATACRGVRCGQARVHAPGAVVEGWGLRGGGECGGKCACAYLWMVAATVACQGYEGGQALREKGGLRRKRELLLCLLACLLACLLVNGWLRLCDASMLAPALGLDRA